MDSKLVLDRGPKTFEGGSVVSESARRFDLLPRPFLEAVADRFEIGENKYGPYNYRKSLQNQDFRTERINHAISHLLNYAHNITTVEDGPADNLAAAGWAIAILLEYEELARANREKETV